MGQGYVTNKYQNQNLSPTYLTSDPAGAQKLPC